MRIAILVPSRERPENIINLFKSVDQSISGNYGIDFLIGLDRDDPTIEQYYNKIYLMSITRNPLIDVIPYIDQLPTIGVIWNALSRIRPWEQTADLFIMGNDDQLFKTQNWDKILVDSIITKDHPFYMSWFNDGINYNKHCAFPIVSKLWVAALGHFTPEIFQFFYHDTWVYDIAKRAKVLNYIGEVLVDHMHHSRADGYRADKTTQRARENNSNQVDKTIWEKSESTRVAIADELQKKINEYLLTQLNKKL